MKSLEARCNHLLRFFEILYAILCVGKSPTCTQHSCCQPCNISHPSARWAPVVQGGYAHCTALIPSYLCHLPESNLLCCRKCLNCKEVMFCV